MKRMTFKRLQPSGFTLIEMMVATAVGGIIIVIMMNFTANYIKTTAVQEARDTLLSEAQLGLDSISQVIRLSASANDTNLWPDTHDSGAPLDLYSWSSSSSTLVLATAAQDSSGKIIFSDPLDYVSAKNNNIYFVSNMVLYRRVLADPLAVGNTAKTTCPKAASSSSCPADNVLMNNVSSFSVTYIDNSGNTVTDSTDARAVQLSVTLSTTKYNTPISVSYSTRTVFRNE